MLNTSSDKNKYSHKVLIFFVTLFLAIFSTVSAGETKPGTYVLGNALRAAVQIDDNMPIQRSAPVTTGNKATGALIDLDGSSLIIVIDSSKKLTDSGVSLDNEMIDLVKSTLQDLLGANVTYFNSDALRGFGLPDAEAVHNLVINNLLATVDGYIRVYIDLVDGPQFKKNIRVDLYLWLPGGGEGLDLDLGIDLAALEPLLSTPGQYIVGLEIERDVLVAILGLAESLDL